jgi:hypothetical protein
VSAGVTRHVGSQSDDLTRGGPLMATPNGYQLTSAINSRGNVPTTWSARVSYFDDDFGGWSVTTSTTLTIRPASRWQASMDPTWSRVVDARQYIGTRTGGRSATYGQRYIFSFIERSTLSTRFRLNYAFTPNFTVEGYAEPFAASGRFYDHGELSAARSAEQRLYGADGTGTSVQLNADGTRTVRDGASTLTLPALDFNRLSFRSNLVLRWEWLPGSTAFLIWQQSRTGQDPVGRLIGAGDLLNASRAAGDNFLVAKVSWLLGVR